MKLHTLEGVSFNEDKFPKLVITGYYCKNLWIPVKGEINPLKDEFKLIKTREKGTLLIVPCENPDNRILLAGQIESGFRGSVVIYEIKNANNAVLWSDKNSKHCKEILSFAVILDLDDSIVFCSSGRYGANIIVFANENGEIKKQVFVRDEYLAMKDSINFEGEEL